MHQPFLLRLAEKIKTRHTGLGHRLCVVMPNRRAGLYLKRYLVNDEDKPVWAPSVFSIEDFITQISNLNIPDPLSQMFGLYEAHCSVEEGDAVDFDDFTGWSKGLIRDFDEIDQYLVDPLTLFGYLSESKAISLWNMEGQPLTDFEKRYLQFFSRLPSYYARFTSSLRAKGQAYHGLACRTVAENPAKYLSDLPWTYVIFAGFNAITPAQLVIIRELIARKNAEIVWDADAYYIENQEQEAGRFLREYLRDKSLGVPEELSRYFEAGEKTIRMAGVPRNIGQARLAGNILKELLERKPADVLNRTAVVLADESLLLPLLNAIPEKAGQFNVTMGYPLPHAPLYGFFDNLISLHVNAGAGRNADVSYFYYKDLLSVIRHPYSLLIAGNDTINTIGDKLKTSKNAFLSAAGFFEPETGNSDKATGFSSLFVKVQSATDLTALLIRSIELLKSIPGIAGSGETAYRSADGEILYSLALIVNRLHTLAGETGLIGELRTLQSLFREAAAAMPVPFYGEPLEGIQVMGMLETRVLDFENVILISANEDTLPSKKSYTSFIPFDIRRQFGLPTHHDQQAVFAYHFYRLLQRSKNAWLIYNSEADELGGGERSRFLSQIATEMPDFNPAISIQELNPVTSAHSGPHRSIEVKKSLAVLQKLNSLAQNGFSPTSLNAYLTCPLRFYFAHILKLDETEVTGESIDFRTLGIVIHTVLQLFFEPFTGKLPGREDYRVMQENAPGLIGKALEMHYPGGDVTNGRNLLIVKVANVWINRFLAMEAESCKAKGGDRILGLEKQLKAFLRPDLPGPGPAEILIKGFADRIDLTGGVLRIIDYKTGNVKPSELKPGSVDEVFDPDKAPMEKAFQLMTYLWLAGNSPEFSVHASRIQAGIISFRSLKDGFLFLELPDGGQQDILEQFQEQLHMLFRELYNPDIPFTQTTEKEHCIQCAFKRICHKPEDKKIW